jgi:hypothetical protein
MGFLHALTTVFLHHPWRWLPIDATTDAEMVAFLDVRGISEERSRKIIIEMPISCVDPR